MQEDDKSVCAYCGEVIETETDQTFDPVTDQTYHKDCWHHHRLDEVSDAYNKDGVRGLERIEKEDALNESLGLS